MEKKLIIYQDSETILEASIAYPKNENAPIVVVCHAWNGRDAVVQEAIEKIAGWGYVGFALDVYGKGVLGKSREENIQLKAPFLKDRQMLKRRLMKGLDQAKMMGDASKIVVMGFGFGGLCALDLARSDPSIKGVISIYGHFEESDGLKNSAIKAKVLLLHGADDPIVTTDELYAFGDDLIKHKVYWQSHIFDKTLHAFMNPKVNDPANGVQYQSTTALLVWGYIETFLHEIFSEV